MNDRNSVASVQQARHWRRLAWVLYALVLGGSALAVPWLIDLRNLAAVLSGARVGYLAAMLAAFFASSVFRAARLQVLLHADATYGAVFAAQSIGYMVNSLVPLRAGDIAIAIVLRRNIGIAASRALSTVFLDRLLDLLTILLLVLSLLPHISEIPASAVADLPYLLTAIALGCLVLALMIYKRPVFLRICEGLLEPITLLDSGRWILRIDQVLIGLAVLARPRVLVLTLVLSVLVWATAALSYGFGMAAFGIEISYVGVLVTLGISVLGLTIPIAPSGIGVFHASVIFALSLFHVPFAAALAFALTYHALILMASVLIGLVVVIWQGYGIGEFFRNRGGALSDEGDTPAAR